MGFFINLAYLRLRRYKLTLALRIFLDFLTAITASQMESHRVVWIRVPTVNLLCVSFASKTVRLLPFRRGQLAGVLLGCDYFRDVVCFGADWPEDDVVNRAAGV